MVYYMGYAIKLWSDTASRNLIIILGRFMEIARPISNPRWLFMSWVIWDTSDFFVEQKTSSMCFVTETRILFVCLEDISGSLTSNLRGKGLSYALTTFYEQWESHLSWSNLTRFVPLWHWRGSNIPGSRHASGNRRTTRLVLRRTGRNQRRRSSTLNSNDFSEQADVPIQVIGDQSWGGAARRLWFAPNMKSKTFM
jgi:hypothetical protein